MITARCLLVGDLKPESRSKARPNAPRTQNAVWDSRGICPALNATMVMHLYNVLVYEK